MPCLRKPSVRLASILAGRGLLDCRRARPATRARRAASGRGTHGPLRSSRSCARAPLHHRDPRPQPSSDHYQPPDAHRSSPAAARATDGTYTRPIRPWGSRRRAARRRSPGGEPEGGAESRGRAPEQSSERDVVFAPSRGLEDRSHLVTICRKGSRGRAGAPARPSALEGGWSTRQVAKPRGKQAERVGRKETRQEAPDERA